MTSNQHSVRTIVQGSRTLEEIYEDEAHQIVDEAIDNAMKRLMAKFENVSNIRTDEMAENEQEKGTIDPETGELIPNVKWMSAENFTVAGGLEKVEEFIQVGLIAKLLVTLMIIIIVFISTRY